MLEKPSLWLNKKILEKTIGQITPLKERCQLLQIFWSDQKAKTVNSANIQILFH